MTVSGKSFAMQSSWFSYFVIFFPRLFINIVDYFGEPEKFRHSVVKILSFSSLR